MSTEKNIEFLPVFFSSNGMTNKLLKANYERVVFDSTTDGILSDDIKSVCASDQQYIVYDIEGMHFKTSKPISTNALRLYVFAIVAYTKGRGKSRACSFSLDDWMRVTSRKSKTTEKRLLYETMLELKSLQIDITSSYNNDGNITGFCNVFNDFICQSDGVYYFEINRYIANYFDTYGSKQGCYLLANVMWQINGMKYPYAFALATHILYIKKRNVGKGREGNNHEDVFTVSELIEICKGRGMPSVDDVRGGNRHTYDRIIMPFIKNMNALKDVCLFDWYFCKPHGMNMSASEKAETLADVDEFMKSRVRIEWINAPDYTMTISARNKRQRALEKKAFDESIKGKQHNQSKDIREYDPLA